MTPITNTPCRGKRLLHDLPRPDEIRLGGERGEVIFLIVHCFQQEIVAKCTQSLSEFRSFVLPFRQYFGLDFPAAGRCPAVMKILPFRLVYYVANVKQVTPR